jgi:uncharacterized protein (TIGR02265 family)
MSGGVIFRHSVEAFVERVLVAQGLMSPEFERELKRLGLDVAHPAEVNLETWSALVRAASRRMSPSKREADALEDVGRHMLRGFAASLVGKGLFLALRMLGPRRAVLRMPENYRSADSITHVIAREVSPTCMELTFNTTGGMPTYVRGLMLESMTHVGAREPRVTFEERANETVFVLSWEE